MRTYVWHRIAADNQSQLIVVLPDKLLCFTGGGCVHRIDGRDVAYFQIIQMFDEYRTEWQRLPVELGW